MDSELTDAINYLPQHIFLPAGDKHRTHGPQRRLVNDEQIEAMLKRVHKGAERWRKARTAYLKAIDERTELIWEASKYLTYTEIAQVYGLDHKGVSKIIERKAKSEAN